MTAPEAPAAEHHPDMPGPVVTVIQTRMVTVCVADEPLLTAEEAALDAALLLDDTAWRATDYETHLTFHPDGSMVHTVTYAPEGATVSCSPFTPSVPRTSTTPATA